MKFQKGEIAIYVKPESQFYGKEVEIIGPEEMIIFIDMEEQPLLDIQDWSTIIVIRAGAN